MAPELVKQHPEGLEVITGNPGSFPRVRILRPQAGDEIIQAVAHCVYKNGIPGVPVWNLPQSKRNCLFDYLTDPEMGTLSTGSDTDSDFPSISMRNGLLLLKDLLTGGILRFALE